MFALGNCKSDQAGRHVGLKEQLHRNYTNEKGLLSVGRASF
jgi:hypothetical protein